MFTTRPLTSELAQAVQVPINGQLVEVHLNDQSDLPKGDGSRKVATHCVLNENYTTAAERIRNLAVYKDDLWVVTAPKCGTTWTQEMMWLLDHNLDYSKAADVNLLARTVFLEFSTLVPQIEEDSIERVERMERPRHIKSHLPMALLPKQLWTVRPRIVYCTRNPKDMITSFYHHYRHLHGYAGSKECFLEAVLQDLVMFQPQIPHTLDFWSIRNEPNVLFIHFEEMKRNMIEVLVRASRFLGISYTREQLSRLENHLSFDVMKNNNSANHSALLDTVQSLSGHGNAKSSEFRFMRKGLVGAYREELSDEYIARLDEYIQRQLHWTDFRFME